MASVLTVGVAEYLLRLDDQATGKLQGFNESVGMGGRQMAALGAGATAAGAAVLAGLGASTSAAMDFHTALAEVNTLGVKDLGALSDAVRKVAKEYGLDLVDATKAAYQAISAGATEAEVPLLLERAAIAARAGISDLTTAIELGTGVSNAFGQTMGEVNTIFDQSFATVKLGVTTFGELAGSVGKVAPTMSALGLSTEEMFASLGALTKAGINTAEATTGLKAALSNIIKPTDDALAMAEQLGIQFDAAALSSMGLEGFLQMLAEATGGNVEQMSAFFGSTEALNAVLALTGTQAGSFSGLLEEMRTKTGQAGEAFAKFKETSEQFAWDQLMAELRDLSIEVGEKLLPAFRGLVEAAIPVIKWMGDFAAAHPNVTTGLVGVAAAVGVLGTVLGPILISLASFKFLFAGVGAGAAAAAGTAGGGAAAGTGLLGVAAAAGTMGIALAATVGVVGLTGLALAGVVHEGLKLRDAYKQQAESQARLDEQMEKYTESVRAQGVVMNEAALAEMDHAQQRRYLAELEKQHADAGLRAVMQHYAMRIETEEEFTQARNLLLNENISMQEAAAVAMSQIDAKLKTELLQADREQVREFLEKNNLMQDISNAAAFDMAEGTMEAAIERQRVWTVSLEEMILADQAAAETSKSIWWDYVQSVGSWLSGLWDSFLGLLGLGGQVTAGTGLDVPQMAGGGLVESMGYVDVHKDERILLPRGAEVVPRMHSPAVRAAMDGGGGGSGVTVNMGGVTIANDMDVDRVAAELGRRVQQAFRARGLNPAMG